MEMFACDSPAAIWIAQGCFAVAGGLVGYGVIRSVIQSFGNSNPLGGQGGSQLHDGVEFPDSREGKRELGLYTKAKALVEMMNQEGLRETKSFTMAALLEVRCKAITERLQALRVSIE